MNKKEEPSKDVRILIGIFALILTIVMVGMIIYLKSQDNPLTPSETDLMCVDDPSLAICSYEIELATCLTENDVKYFYLDSCPHCQQQKADFKKGYEFLMKDECSDGSCPSFVSVVPTWQFGDGSLVTGRQKLSDLAEKAGCKI